MESMDSRGKKSGRRGKAISAKTKTGIGFLQFRKILPVVFLGSIFIFTLLAVGYVIFFRTVFA